MLRIALPKGRLQWRGDHALERLGVDRSSPRSYTYRSPESHVEVKLLRLPDIPRLVNENLIHVGVAPDEWIAEAQSGPIRVAPLCWYQADICLAGPDPVHDVDSLREFAAIRKDRTIHVATQYPNITTQYFRQLTLACKLRTVYGSVEAYPPDLADVILDCVETGETLKANGLHVIDVVVRSCVHVIVAPEVMCEPRLRELVRPVVNILKTMAAPGCLRHPAMSYQPELPVGQTA